MGKHRTDGNVMSIEEMDEAIQQTVVENDRATLSIDVRNATHLDIDFMVTLSSQKRTAYAKAQPQFWRPAKNANDIQKEWFAELILDERYTCLVAEHSYAMLGFIIGKLVPAPEVYDPGGLRLMIDDFCVKDDDSWDNVGAALIDALREVSKKINASQILVVAGHHDSAKCDFLTSVGLSIASRWYVGSI